MSQQEPRARKIGRPRKYDAVRRRPTLTFRVRNGLYERLLAEAIRTEKSMSEVIEDSLNEFFDL
jgi:hypothetical protein